MKAAIKFLRSLGQNRRDFINSSNQSSAKQEEYSAKKSESNNHQKLNFESVRLPSLSFKKSKEMSLLDLHKGLTPIKLNADEEDYIELTKEYRQYDEIRFKAF